LPAVEERLTAEAPCSLRETQKRAVEFPRLPHLKFEMCGTRPNRAYTIGMKKREECKGLIIDARASEMHGLWTWRCWIEKPDGTKLGEFIPEGPEVHRSAEGALSSAIANGKKRIDDELVLGGEE